jgi:hypothetical protein
MMARRAVLAIVLIAIVLLAGGLAYFAYLASTAPSSNAPTVTHTSPLYAATGTGINTKILVTFSKAMDTTTLNTGTFALAHGTTATTGTVTFTSLTETFAPTANLATNTVYTATVTTGAKDSSGNRLAVNYVWSFTTGPIADTTLPTVTGTSPASPVPLTSSISATFSKTMDPATITAAGTFTIATVTGTVTYAGTTATFTPSSNLANNTQYTATITTAAKDLEGNSLLNNFVWSFVTGTSSNSCSPSTVPLGSDSTVAVLAGAGVTNTGKSNVTGDVDTSPTAAIVGFAGVQSGGPGHIISPGVANSANGIAGAAQTDWTVAFNNATARTLCVQPLSGNIGGQKLPPGLYKSGSSIEISSGDLTLDAGGNANAVWIFQISSTLTTSPGLHVILAGGALQKNIFWVVGSSATLATNSVLYGTILARQSITVATGATLNGRALASIGAVTLDTNTITP